MTLAELQAEKIKLQAAIDKVLVAQSYNEGGTQVQKANLDSLYRRLDICDARIARLATNGGVTATVIMGDCK